MVEDPRSNASSSGIQFRDPCRPPERCESYARIEHMYEDASDESKATLLRGALIQELGNVRRRLTELPTRTDLAAIASDIKELKALPPS